MTFINHVSWNRPFTFKLKKPIRFHFDKGWRKGEWSLSVHIGPGAGYILGSTIYLARKCMTNGHNRHVVPWQFGWTTNGNNIPGARH